MGSLSGSLKDKAVLIVGRGSGLARAVGAWDAFGEQGKADYFADISARNPVRRIGTPEDVAQAVMLALTNTFLTGQTLHVDGGEPLT